MDKRANQAQIAKGREECNAIKFTKKKQERVGNVTNPVEKRIYKKAATIKERVLSLAITAKV
ncbi:MAG: hypothetical protein WAM14_20115 [Candidatus Nitrosopolaris sp.]